MLVVVVEIQLALVKAGDPRLECVELALRMLRTCACLVDGLREPTDLVLTGTDSAALSGDLAGQPGQALAPVCGRPDRGGEPPLFVLVRSFRVRARRGRRR